MTPEERAELRRLAEAATPGPWKTNIVDVTLIQSPAVEVASTSNPAGVLGAYENQYEKMEADAAFIAASRAAVPALLDALDAAEAERARIMGLLRKDPNTFLYASEDGEVERLSRLLNAAEARVARLLETLRPFCFFAYPDSFASGDKTACTEVVLHDEDVRRARRIVQDCEALGCGAVDTKEKKP